MFVFVWLHVCVCHNLKRIRLCRQWKMNKRWKNVKKIQVSTVVECCKKEDKRRRWRKNTLFVSKYRRKKKKKVFLKQRAPLSGVKTMGEMLIAEIFLLSVEYISSVIFFLIPFSISSCPRLLFYTCLLLKLLDVKSMGARFITTREVTSTQLEWHINFVVRLMIS